MRTFLLLVIFFLLLGSSGAEASFGLFTKGSNLNIGNSTKGGSRFYGFFIESGFLKNPNNCFEEVKGFGIGFGGFQDKCFRMTGVDIQAFNSLSDQGLAIGGVVGALEERGLAVGGVVASTPKGLSVGSVAVIGKGVGLGFIAFGDTKISGLGLGAIGVFAQDEISGVALGTVFSGAANKMTGLAVGGLTNTPNTEVKGLAIGLVNVASSMKGVQMGVFNYAHELHGIQVGLINFIKSQEAPFNWLPLINFSF